METALLMFDACEENLPHLIMNTVHTDSPSRGAPEKKVTGLNLHIPKYNHVPYLQPRADQRIVRPQRALLRTCWCRP